MKAKYALFGEAPSLLEICNLLKRSHPEDKSAPPGYTANIKRNKFSRDYVSFANNIGTIKLINSRGNITNIIIKSNIIDFNTIERKLEFELKKEGVILRRLGDYKENIFDKLVKWCYSE